MVLRGLAAILCHRRDVRALDVSEFEDDEFEEELDEEFGEDF